MKEFIENRWNSFLIWDKYDNTYKTVERKEKWNNG